MYQYANSLLSAKFNNNLNLRSFI